MIPIHIISGFLGAGKTTLAGRLLGHCAARGERVVYLVNEFGEIALDADIQRRAGFDAVELAGGCVCCSLKVEASNALMAIEREYRPDRVVFEPSGIFVYDSFLDLVELPMLKDRYAMSGCITVVDGAHFAQGSWHPESFYFNQIARAGSLWISKLDRFSGSVPALEKALRAINPRANLFALPLEGLTGEAFDAMLRAEPPIADSRWDPFHTQMRSLTLRPEPGIPREAFERMIARAGSAPGAEIIRGKGIVQLADGYYQVQLVYDDLTFTPHEPTEKTKFILIGRGIRSFSSPNVRGRRGDETEST